MNAKEKDPSIQNGWIKHFNYITIKQKIVVYKEKNSKHQQILNLLT